jgi:hypothetical protein
MDAPPDSTEETMKDHPLLRPLLLACCALPFTFASADPLADAGAAERGRYLMMTATGVGPSQAIELDE